jgi:hypothetical protein
MNISKKTLVICLVMMTLTAAFCSWRAHENANTAKFWQQQWEVDR